MAKPGTGEGPQVEYDWTRDVDDVLSSGGHVGEILRGIGDPVYQKAFRKASPQALPEDLLEEVKLDNNE